MFCLGNAGAGLVAFSAGLVYIAPALSSLSQRFPLHVVPGVGKFTNP